MKKPLHLAYGVFSYLVSLASFFYFAVWVTNLLLPKTVDSGEPKGTVFSFAVNTVLLLAYCFLHSIFSRTSVKEKTRAFVSRNLERSTYCLVFSLLLVALCLAWQPMPEIVWEVTSPGGVRIMYGLFILCWVLHFWSIFWIDHNDFFGLRQALLSARGEEYRPLPAMSERAYAQSHLLLVVSLMAIPWFTPTMSVGHLYFCVFVSAYEVIGAMLSNRDLGDMPEPVAQT